MGFNKQKGECKAMKKIKIKKWSELDGQANNRFELEYDVCDRKEMIDVVDKKTKMIILFIRIEDMSKETIIKLLKTFDFDIEFIKTLTDDERLAEIQCLMTELGMTELSERQKEIMQKVFDLTKKESD
jgi:ATP-dependent 26S proteasome regulatory subunit